MAGIQHPAAVGFFVSLIVAAALVATKRWHAARTGDSGAGPHKFHDSPTTPRVGGLALLSGYGAAVAVSASPARELLLAAGAAAAVGLLGGLAEDLTKRVHKTVRFVGTSLAGLAFCLLSGHAITRVEIPAVDDALRAAPAIAIALAVLAVAGTAHAINMIDGFHGLAPGTAVILLAAFRLVSLRAGDESLAMFCLAVIGVACGFAALNFPLGALFLGDGGAYFLGVLVAVVAVMVPARNPGVSPWVSLVVLAYPLTEAAVSVIRKLRAGGSPFDPDRRHLHMLVYERLTRKGLGGRRAARLANPATGALLWSNPLLSLGAVALMPLERSYAIAALALLVCFYLACYRRLAPGSAEARRRPC